MFGENHCWNRNLFGGHESIFGGMGTNMPQPPKPQQQNAKTKGLFNRMLFDRGGGASTPQRLIKGLFNRMLFDGEDGKD